MTAFTYTTVRVVGLELYALLDKTGTVVGVSPYASAPGAIDSRNATEAEELEVKAFFKRLGEQ